MFLLEALGKNLFPFLFQLLELPYSLLCGSFHEPVIEHLSLTPATKCSLLLRPNDEIGFPRITQNNLPISKFLIKSAKSSFLCVWYHIHRFQESHYSPYHRTWIQCIGFTVCTSCVYRPSSHSSAFCVLASVSVSVHFKPLSSPFSTSLTFLLHAVSPLDSFLLLRAVLPCGLVRLPGFKSWPCDLCATFGKLHTISVPQFSHL